MLDRLNRTIVPNMTKVTISLIRTSLVATIVTPRTYYSSTVGQSTVTLVACLVPSSRPI